MDQTLIFDRSDRLRIQFSGPNAVTTLDGLVTNNVKTLLAGQGCYAGMLTAKGKIVADIRIFKFEDSILIDVAPGAADGVRDLLKKYVNPRFAKYEDVSATLAHLTLAGPDAAKITATLTNAETSPLNAIAPFGHLTGTVSDTTVTIIRTPEVGIAAFDIIAPTNLRDTLHAAALSAGATDSNAATWESLRIQTAWPAWGTDMDDNTLPQEANFDELQAVSYNKGCYIGQEPVARIHFRGHVNKTLRYLAIDSAVEPPAGAQLFADEDRPIGDIRSMTRANVVPNGAESIVGIGMVRREIANGAMLTARWGDGSESVQAAVQVIGQADGKAKGAIN